MRKNISNDEMEQLIDADLLRIAKERMAHLDESKLIPIKEIDNQLGITEKDLEGYEEVEIE